MFQYLIAELAMGVILSLIPQKVRNVIGGLIMAVGSLVLLLGAAVVVAISDDLANILGALIGVVGLLILGAGWVIRRAAPFESVADTVANAVIDL